MARPIKETPVLTGEDAIRFWEAAENVEPVSQEDKDKANEIYEKYKLAADFPL